MEKVGRDEPPLSVGRGDNHTPCAPLDVPAASAWGSVVGDILKQHGRLGVLANNAGA
jgi:NAD(P)-dependent dehydrogenase (short-subunit alcohol dehydrogenase family)